MGLALAVSERVDGPWAGEGERLPPPLLHASLGPPLHWLGLLLLWENPGRNPSCNNWSCGLMVVGVDWCMLALGQARIDERWHFPMHVGVGLGHGVACHLLV